MFGTLLRILKIVHLIAAFVGSFALSYIILTEVFDVPPVLAGVFVFALFLSLFWMMAAYVRYRIGRQEELLQVLRSAVESQVSLEAAVRAYLADRPSHASGPIVLGIIALVMTPIFPGALLLMLWWYYWFRYDGKVQRFRDCLYDGVPVADALMMVPGVISDEALLEIRVGTQTHRLALALRHAKRERLAGAWLELIPRVLYPLLVLSVLLGVQTFSVVAMVPKFKKIFDEFHMPLPGATKSFISFGTYLADYYYIFGMIKLAALISTVLLIANPTIRWHFPVVGRFYRRDLQGRVLRNLSLLIAAEEPARDALNFLADAPELPQVVRTRLGRAANDSAAGEPLATVLARHILLPAAMAPLILAAERTQTLPWALDELGEHLSVTALRVVRQATLLLAPLVLLALGGLVAFTCIALFLPLVELIIGLSE